LRRLTAKLVEGASGAGPESAGPELVGTPLAKREGSLPGRGVVEETEGTEGTDGTDGTAEPLTDGAGGLAACRGRARARRRLKTEGERMRMADIIEVFGRRRA
jgi:hypothetical protein